MISVLIVTGVVLIKRIFIQHDKYIEEINTLSQAVGQSPVCTIITSPDGILQYANPSFLKFMGLSLNDCIGKNIETICAMGTNSDTYQDIFSVIKSGTDWNGEIAVDNKNNESRYISARISSVNNNNGELDHRFYDGRYYRGKRATKRVKETGTT